VNRISAILLILFSPAIFSFVTLNSKGYTITKVVIDAGHGGHDTGCLGSDSREKVVALSIALKLGKLIEENHPDVKVIYTRKTDVFVELHQRAHIANNNKADLFISIHCNSGPKTASGTETFVMGLHKSDDNLHVAKRENSAVLLEKDYLAKYDGFNPNSPESHIIFSLFQNTFLNQSLLFASKVEDQFKKTALRFSRGVKQAGFLVLYKTTMPSVLIETGFLTNVDEEKFLNAAKGQDKIAECILKAFTDYKKSMESGSGTIHKTEPVQIKPDTLTNHIKSEGQKASSSNKDGDQMLNSTSSSDVFLSVQIASSKYPHSRQSDRFEDIGGIRSEKGTDGSYKYLIGKFRSLEDATIVLKKLKSEGYSDSFLVGFHEGKRITKEEAQLLIESKGNSGEKQ
jgi:N-acetylmuramoyl-L-alanine amidase